MYTGWSKSRCAPDYYSTKTGKNIVNSFIHLPWYIRNVDRATLNNADRATLNNVDRATLNTAFENTIRRVNKCLETGGRHFEHYLNFLYCNHQVYRNFLITLYMYIVFRTYTSLLFIQGSIVNTGTKLVDQRQKNRDSIPGTD
jgi:hypothetical protein